MSSLTRTVDRLEAEQQQVASIVSTLTEAGWSAQLQPFGLERLLTMGHFPDYAVELDWTPREVVGHLRDSARIFADRLRRLRVEDQPRFADFVTDAPDRLADYRATALDELARQLDAAQAELLAAARAVREDELGRTAIHEVAGEVTLGDTVAFLADHQHDHREQLRALTAEALA